MVRFWRVCRGPRRAWHVWREMSRTWEAQIAPEEQVSETETPSRKAEGNQGVGSVHSTQRR